MSMYTKPSTEAVLETINLENNITVMPLTKQNVAFGIPQAVTTPGARQNARVRVYALMRQGYQGSVDIEYQRLSLEHMFLNQTLLVQFSGAKKLSDVLPALHKTYGILLTAEDIVDQDVSTLGEDFFATLTIQNSCLMYSGSIEVRVVKARQNIAAIIKNQLLDIVNLPFSPTTDKRLEYVAWGYDFVEIAAVLLSYGEGAKANPRLVDALQGVVDLKLVYKLHGETAIGEINLNNATVRWGNTNIHAPKRIMELVLDNTMQSTPWAGVLQIPWLPE